MISPRLRPQPRPSLSSRLSLAISTRSEAGEVRHPQEHIEEIDEIRRYEVCYNFLSEQEVSLTVGGATGFYNDRFESSRVSRNLRVIAHAQVADWVQDAARAQLQRRIQQKQNTDGFFERGSTAGWRRKLWQSYDAGQAWIVISLIGEFQDFSIIVVMRY